MKDDTMRTPVSQGSTPDGFGDDAFKPLIVGLGGTTRAGSTSERSVIHALRAAEALGARTELFNGEFLARLPLYSPGAVNPDAQVFLEAIRQCQGIIVATPAFHGGLSAPVKNVLDLLEETARDSVPYLDGRAFGCIVTAYGWQACGTALVSLRMVAHALRAWPTPFGVTLNSSAPLFEPDGRIVDDKAASQLALVASQVVEFARCRAAGRERGGAGASRQGQ